MENRIDVVARTEDLLGETVVWLAKRKCVAWIDAIRCRVHLQEIEADRLRTLEIGFSGPLGAILRGFDEGSVLLVGPGVVGTLDLDHGHFERLITLDAERHDIVCNDAKVDPHGDLWVGTCERAEQEPRGALYRITPEKEVALFDAGFIVPNGPAFSPDGSTVYVSDTMKGRILAYTLDAQGMEMRPRQVFADLTAMRGLPDGLTVDRDGNIWCALWGGAGIACFGADGKMLDTIALPATNVTSLAFGGDDLRDLYVTSARTGMAEVSLSAEPLAGSLFRVRTSVQGIAEKPWTGINALQSTADHPERTL